MALMRLKVDHEEDWAFAVKNFLVLEGLSEYIKWHGDGNAKEKAKTILTIDPSLYVHSKHVENTMTLWYTL